MKKIFCLYILSAVILVSCKSNGETYGDKISNAEAIAVSEVPKLLEGKDSIQVKATGKIVECCQKKGCWMTMDLGDGESVHVTFKDYGFFVPLNSGGRTAVIEGIARKRMVPVMELRHYAEDAGKSKEEIEAIAEPAEGYSFVANGVVLKD